MAAHSDIHDGPTAVPFWDRTVDGASLAVFRIGFGAIAAFWAIDYMLRGRLQAIYIDPAFHFTYYMFDWVRPLPGNGMYYLFVGFALCGLAIATGFCYRIATWCFALGFTYYFLLERTNYQNHYYLMTLLSWLLVLLPLNRLWSLDVRWGIVSPSTQLPAWMLWLTRFHIGIPYFFGGVAKFDADWFAGEPLRQTLASRQDWPFIGTWLTEEWVVQGFIWGGLTFDLLIVPLLLWRRTRLPAYLLCLLFHLLNSQLFAIHIFPWFMMIATTVFFEPDWPRRVLPGKRSVPEAQLTGEPTWPRLRRWAIWCLLAYGLLHCLLPLRHWLYEGQTNWTERGHHFAWRMMLRAKSAGFRFFMTDAETGETFVPDVRTALSPQQISSFGRDPEMILHLAHYLATEYRQLTGRDVEVRAIVLTSLNGRKPQLQIDPTVDLAKEPRGFYHRQWITPLTEPLPESPWRVPMQEWERLIEIPPLPFMLKSKAGSVSNERE